MKSRVITKNGRSTISDPVDGRPITIGDGIIPQVERFASKYVYNELTVDAFTTALQMMVEKAENPTGNEFVFVVNEKLWYDIQRVLAEWLSNWSTCEPSLWSKKANGMVKVGTTFNAYEIAGNSVQFRVDRTFSREYGHNKGFGLMIDLTADKVSGTPAIQAFSLKGADFIQNRVVGVGGIDGLSSGVVSSPVAASKVIIHGYSGVGVFNPYRSFILRQA